MRTYSWILIVAAMTPLLPLACGRGPSSTTPRGTGGSAPDAATTSAATTTSAASSTTGGDPIDCSDLLQPNGCTTCVEGSCCNELAACGATEGCIACQGGDAASCVAENKQALDALTTCLQASCDVPCSAAPPDTDPTCAVPAVAPSNGACVTLSADVTCNPVTNEPCAADEACDINTSTGFVCYTPPPANTGAVCAACSLSSGVACLGGEICINDVCVRFCCTDADCGAGTCDKAVLLGNIVGICLGGN